MSKIKELKNESRAVAVTDDPKLPATPATTDYAEELDNFRQAAAEGMQAAFLGTLLRFRQGDWIYGKEQQELQPGTRLIALMNELRLGWVKWIDKKAVKQVIGKVADGFHSPEREELAARPASAFQCRKGLVRPVPNAGDGAAADPRRLDD
jgi:hypothetical protein